MADITVELLLRRKGCTLLGSARHTGGAQSGTVGQSGGRGWCPLSLDFNDRRWWSVARLDEDDVCLSGVRGGVCSKLMKGLGRLI